MILPDIYVSTDIETDGWQVGRNSILSLGAVALFEDKTVVGKFSANLETLPDAVQDKEVMDWWETQPKAWKACRQDCQPPKEVMQNYYRWVTQLPGCPIFVATPLVFDYGYVNAYLQRFVGKNPFEFSTIDIRSLVMGMNGCAYGYTDSTCEDYEELPHTHIAVEDALAQGLLLCNLLKAAKRKKR